jgi:photosystem II stability/assembly factor-like uncharacterized protein
MKIALIFVAILSSIVEGTWYQNSVPVTTVDWVSAVWSSANRCVMVGYNSNNGAIVQTIDGGATWQTIDTTVSQTTDIAHLRGDSTDPYFISVAANGNIYVSSDKGATFPPVITLAAQLYGVTIGTSKVAYAVGVTSGNPSKSKVFTSTFSANSPYTVWNDVSPTASVLFTAASSYDGVNVIVVGYSMNVFFSTNSGT